MTRPSTNRKRKPTFVWQALLIVLPVAVLAVFGFVSLRQDRVLAQHDATERAQAIADDLLARVWATLMSGYMNEQNAFRVDQTGELLFPPPYAPAPIPQPLNETELDPAQARLWQTAQAAESESPDAAGAWQQFLAANPPARFAALARYGVGLALTKQGNAQAAAEAFELVAAKFPGALGASGLPLQPLAQAKLFELRRAETNQTGLATLTSLCSNAVSQPTLMTPYLLTLYSNQADSLAARLAVSSWQEKWQANEIQRELFAAAHPHLRRAAEASHETLPRLFWFTAPVAWRQMVTNWAGVSTNGILIPKAEEITGSEWLAADVGRSPTQHWFACWSQPETASALASVVNPATPLPPYFGLDVELAGKTLPGLARDLRVWREVHYNAKGSGERKEYTTDLATTILASATKTEAGADLLKVTIYLTSPAALFKLQNARTFWFGSLILFSAFAALFGLLAAWRAFHRQLQLSEMKSNFVASVSHELRAPIASVRLMAESLERGKVSEPAKQNEYFRFIGQESRRLSSLIENVLDFSRIEQGRKQYEFEPTDLLALTQQTVKIMEPYAAEREIHLAFDSQLSTLDAQLTADGRALQQALVNLLDNAIKHSPKGATVTVGLERKCSVFSVQYSESDNRPNAPAASRTDEGAASILLYVEDAGAGIPAEEHQKIFERFYRLGSELRRETQGVGIGLSIVKHIVEAHGGRVVVRSAPGEGSRFTIELPFKPENE